MHHCMFVCVSHDSLWVGTDAVEEETFPFSYPIPATFSIAPLPTGDEYLVITLGTKDYCIMQSSVHYDFNKPLY